MSREDAIKRARAHFDSGDFRDVLARRVAIRTESQEQASGGEPGARNARLFLPDRTA
jgi:hypothetical protein